MPFWSASVPNGIGDSPEERRVKAVFGLGGGVEVRLSRSFLDDYPVSKGHTLIVPKQHVVSLFDLPEDGQREPWTQVGVIREPLAAKYDPAGFNIGLNDGRAAAQTVGRAHNPTATGPTGMEVARPLSVLSDITGYVL